MAHKIKFKGKTYTVIDYLENTDIDIIKRKARVKNSKGEEFTFVQSILGFYLYDKKCNRIAETLSVLEWDT